MRAAKMVVLAIVILAQLVFDGWWIYDRTTAPAFNPRAFSTSTFPGNWTAYVASDTIWRIESHTGHVDVYDKTVAKWRGVGEPSADGIELTPVR